MRLILGAGLAGLAAGLSLKEANQGQFLILEAGSSPGGLARSRNLNGWLFDRTGHFLHFTDERVKCLVERYVPLRPVQRRSVVLWRGLHIPAPFQTHLRFVPPDLRVEMVLSAALASYDNRKSVETFEDWIVSSVGECLAKEFLLPYNRKMLRADPASLLPEQGGRFIPRPDFRAILEGALGAKSDSTGYNDVFYYPVRNGIGSIPAAFADQLRGNIAYEHSVVSVDCGRKEVVCANGSRFSYEGDLISTLPLPEFVEMLRGVPSSLRQAANQLRATTILCLNLAIDGPLNTDIHWAYVGDPQHSFYRIGSLSNVSASTVPQGCSSLWAEISIGDGCFLDSETLDGLRREVVEFARSKSLLRPESVVRFVDVDFIRHGYVLYDLARSQVLSNVLSVLGSLGIRSLGRYGLWKYDSMEGAIRDGLSVGRLGQ